MVSLLMLSPQEAMPVPQREPMARESLPSGVDGRFALTESITQELKAALRDEHCLFEQVSSSCRPRT